MKECSIQQ